MTFDSLRVHASKLPLEQKVQLVKELKESIDKEVSKLQEAAGDAMALSNSLVVVK